MTIQDRIKDLIRVPAGELLSNPKNWRRHPEKQRSALSGVLAEIGWADAVLARETADGLMLIDGHLRTEVAPDAEIPVLVLDVSEDEADKILLTHDPLGDMAETNAAALDLLMRDVNTGSEGVQEMLAELANSAGLYTDDANEIVEDEVPEPPKTAVVQPGEIWQLGSHRLMCGDSTNAQDVLLLIDDNKVDLCFTSPPYNLGQSSKLSGNKTLKLTGNAYNAHDDDTSDVHWHEMVSAMIGNALDCCDVAIFNVQPLAGNKRVIWKWIADLSDRICDILVWDKQHAAPAMAQSVMSSQYELLVVVGEVGASRAIPHSDWRGTVASVYTAPPQRKNEFSGVHGATFPMHLPAFVMGTLCNTSKSVYDCCMGVGTTLIACEQLNRQSYGMEIDPIYCDVIIERWQNLTGQKAKRVKDGH